jgi:hypothetical protein
MLSDLELNGARRADALSAGGIDHAGSRIWLQQANFLLSQRDALSLGPLDRAKALLFDSNFAETQGTALRTGGGSGGSEVALFTGASSNNTLTIDASSGARTLVRDFWSETKDPARAVFAKATGDAELTLHGGKIQLVPGPEPAILLRDFSGRASVVAELFFGLLVTAGSCAGSRAIALATQGPVSGPFILDQAVSRGQLTETGCRHMGTSLIAPLPDADQGSTEPAVIEAGLAATRRWASEPRLSAVPAGASDLRLIRVHTYEARDGVRISD